MTGLEESELSAFFDKDVRPFLDAIDNLRKFGLDEDLKLPTVVVIGDQSSGKSSILEAISGIRLPRGTGMVTKCPLQLQLKQTKSKPWSATLSYNDKYNAVVQKVIKNASEVDDEITNAQNEILGDSDGISETLLTLRVEDAHVPDLTLVDLPGIARVSVGDQAKDLPMQIIGLLQKYISREETIILSVSPCNVDLATTESLKMSQEYDVNSSRTFGVLTKADLIDQGSEFEILKVLNNEVVPLTKGYTIVKCRNQKALNKNQSLQTSLANEKKFFENHEIFRTLDKSQWGITTLSKKLAKELFDIIKNEIPNIRKTIIEKEMLLSNQLNSYIFNYPTSAENRLMFSLKVTNSFLSLLHDLIEGKYFSQELEEIESSNLLCPNLRLIPFSREQFDILYNDLVKATQGVQLEQTLEKLIKISQGKEPHDFLSYDTFKQVARIFIQNAKPFTLSCMNVVSKNLELVLQCLMNHYLKKYSTFHTNISIVVREIFRKANEDCGKDLQLIFDKEMIFFTMDRFYDEKIDALEALKDVKYTLRTDWLKYFEKPNNPNNPTFQEKQKDQMPKYVVVYYLLAISKISDQVSVTILYWLMSNFYKTLSEKLLCHVAQPDTYNLLENAASGVQDKKDILKHKLEGLQKGIEEIDKIFSFGPCSPMQACEENNNNDLY